MSNLIYFLTAVWLSSTAAQLTSIVSSASKSIVSIAKTEVASVEQPVAEVAVTVVFSQCQTVKNVFNVDEDAYEDDEPDLSKLTLNYYSEAMNATYKLSDAATLISKASWFDPTQNLYIFMHGFTDNPGQQSFQSINNALMSQGQVNVLGLDASSLIRWLYLRSSTFIIFIGEKLGEVLAALVNAGLNANSIHLIGHSLGAHISGYAGKSFSNTTGLKIGRISGLDPAGPCFNLPENETLNMYDADFVDVIHTDAGIFGIDKQLGHVDHWPNEGAQQPNCLLPTCSHSRAWEYFGESVTNPENFLGVSCSSWDEFRDGFCNDTDTSYMGFGCVPGTTGNYFLQTNGTSPYGRGQSGLKFVNNEGIVRNTLTLIGG